MKFEETSVEFPAVKNLSRLILWQWDFSRFLIAPKEAGVLQTLENIYTSRTTARCCTVLYSNTRIISGDYIRIAPTTMTRGLGAGTKDHVPPLGLSPAFAN